MSPSTWGLCSGGALRRRASSSTRPTSACTIAAYAASLRPRVVEAPAVDRAVDQAGMLREQGVGVETELREDAGPEVVEQHVAREREPPHEVGALVGAEVDGDGSLARVHPREVHADRFVADLRSQHADDVALRGLDLHDVGAEVGEHAATDRTGHDLREVEHTDAVERQRVRGTARSRWWPSWCPKDIERSAWVPTPRRGGRTDRCQVGDNRAGFAGDHGSGVTVSELRLAATWRTRRARAPALRRRITAVRRRSPLRARGGRPSTQVPPEHRGDGTPVHERVYRIAGSPSTGTALARGRGPADEDGFHHRRPLVNCLNAPQNTSRHMPQVARRNRRSSCT